MLYSLRGIRGGLGGPQDKISASTPKVHTARQVGSWHPARQHYPSKAQNYCRVRWVREVKFPKIRNSKAKKMNRYFPAEPNLYLILGALCTHVINRWVLQLVHWLLAFLLYCHVRVQSDRPLALVYDMLSGELLSQSVLSHAWLCPANEPCGEHSRDVFSEEANGVMTQHCKYLDSILLKIKIYRSSGSFCSGARNLLC